MRVVERIPLFRDQLMAQITIVVNHLVTVNPWSDNSRHATPQWRRSRKSLRPRGAGLLRLRMHSDLCSTSSVSNELVRKTGNSVGHWHQLPGDLEPALLDQLSFLPRKEFV
jgi:hypothetical protein